MVDNSSSPGAVTGTSVLLIKFVRAVVAKKRYGEDEGRERGEEGDLRRKRKRIPKAGTGGNEGKNVAENAKGRRDLYPDGRGNGKERKRVGHAAAKPAGLWEVS